MGAEFYSSHKSNPARAFRFKIGTGQDTWWYANNASLPSFDIESGEYLLLNQKFKIPGVATWNDVTINIVDIGGKTGSYAALQKVLDFHKFTYDRQFGYVEGIKKTNSPEAELAVQFRKANPLPPAGEVTQQEGETEREALARATKEAREKRLKLKKDKERAAKKGRKLPNRLTEPDTGRRKPISKDTQLAKQQNFVIEQLNDKGQTFRKWTLVNSFIRSVNYGELDYSSDELVSIEITVAYDYATIDK